MERKEALKRALKELVEARHNLRNGQKNGVPPEQMAALREKVEYRETVVEAIRLIPNGEPLTLEQLREMDGQPAYWKEDESWGIISVYGAGKWDGIPFFRGRKNGANFEYDIESRGMEVYSYPPAHIDREAWTAEWKDSYKSGVHAGDGYVCSFCDMWSGRKSHFCPNCGKAMDEYGLSLLEKRLRG